MRPPRPRSGERKARMKVHPSQVSVALVVAAVLAVSACVPRAEQLSDAGSQLATLGTSIDGMPFEAGAGDSSASDVLAGIVADTPPESVEPVVCRERHVLKWIVSEEDAESDDDFVDLGFASLPIDASGRSQFVYAMGRAFRSEVDAQAFFGDLTASSALCEAGYSHDAWDADASQTGEWKVVRESVGRREAELVDGPDGARVFRGLSFDSVVISGGEPSASNVRWAYVVYGNVIVHFRSYDTVESAPLTSEQRDGLVGAIVDALAAADD